MDELEKTKDVVKELNMNQNLLGLFVAFVALGFSEYYCLDTLYWFSLVFSVMNILSLLFTLYFYTWAYCRKKYSPRNDG